MTAAATEPWTTARHPLARLLRSVAAGQFPHQDGAWTRVSPWIPTLQAIVGFTGHSILAVSYDVSEETLIDLGATGFDGPFSARVVTALAGATGWIGPQQVLLSALGTGSGNSGALVARADLSRHPFVENAKRIRQDIQVLGTADAHPDIVVLGRGVAGIREISVQVNHQTPGRGESLFAAALATVPEYEVVLATIPVYDGHGLGSAIAGGFRPIGGVQLFSNRPEHKL